MRLFLLKILLVSTVVSFSSCEEEENTLLGSSDDASTDSAIIDSLNLVIAGLQTKVGMLETELLEVGISEPTESELQAQIDVFETEEQRLVSNTALATGFYQDFFGDKNIESIHNYIGDVYIQHNPRLLDGKQALIDAATGWFEGSSTETIDFQKVMAQDDLVFLHIKSSDGETSIMDVFRVEDNMLVEHWDLRGDIEDAIDGHPHPLF